MKDLTQEVSPHLTGRLARYVADITAARERGVTWRQITEAIGPEIGLDIGADPAARKLAEKRMQVAYGRARKQVAKGRLRTGPAQTTTATPGRTGMVNSTGKPDTGAGGFKTL